MSVQADGDLQRTTATVVLQPEWHQLWGAIASGGNQRWGFSGSSGVFCVSQGNSLCAARPSSVDISHILLIARSLCQLRPVCLAHYHATVTCTQQDIGVLSNKAVAAESIVQRYNESLWGGCTFEVGARLHHRRYHAPFHGPCHGRVPVQ